jgi:hypothetical protein
MVDNLEISGSDARRIMAGEGLDVWREHTGRKEPGTCACTCPR